MPHRSLLIVCLLVVSTTANYDRIYSSVEYHRQWQQQVPEASIHDVSHLTKYDELCSGTKCPFVYYEYRKDNVTDATRNRSVLLVAGMHGN